MYTLYIIHTYIYTKGHTSHDMSIEYSMPFDCWLGDHCRSDAVSIQWSDAVWSDALVRAHCIRLLLTLSFVIIIIIMLVWAFRHWQCYMKQESVKYWCYREVFNTKFWVRHIWSNHLQTDLRRKAHEKSSGCLCNCHQWQQPTASGRQRTALMNFSTKYMWPVKTTEDIMKSAELWCRHCKFWFVTAELNGWWLYFVCVYILCCWVVMSAL